MECSVWQVLDIKIAAHLGDELSYKLGAAVGGQELWYAIRDNLVLEGHVRDVCRRSFR